ncbi:OmpH family outer membrane protein [Gracilimonas sp. Q87]|uniref:OmpH family outer membrane protein n=1 Tax=Gracilimonas sp. Q87 TaxID=3384766 RepID=UPI00398411AD
MSNIRVTFILALFLILSPDVVGQDQRLGYFESDLILENIPEYNSIQQQLNMISSQWEAEIQQMESQIERLQEDYEAKEILYTDEIRNQRKQEIENKIQAKEAYVAQKFGPEGEYFSRQKELLEPIQRQVFAAVRTIAQRQNYDFVFDRSGDIYMVYANDAYNLNDLILEELGIETDTE